MRFDAYGRFQLEVMRLGARWTVYRTENGRCQLLPDLVIPPSTPAEDISRYLDDLLHELAEPGRVLRRID